MWLSGQGEGGLVRRLHELGVRIRYEPAAAVEHRMPAARASLDYARFRARLEGIQHSVRWTRTAARFQAGRLAQALLVVEDLPLSLLGDPDDPRFLLGERDGDAADDRLAVFAQPEAGDEILATLLESAAVDRRPLDDHAVPGT